MDPAPTEIYTLSLHDALPIWARSPDRLCERRDGHARGHSPGSGAWGEPGEPAALLCRVLRRARRARCARGGPRSEEHTSELQSHSDLVCRLLLEKKKL